MNKSLALLLTAVLLGVASAQTTTPPTTSTALPGTVPASVPRGADDALGKFLAAGGKVELVDASGSVVGTLNGGGTVTLVAGATLADARAVQVVPPAGQGEPTTYPLARDLSRPGAIKLEVQGPNGKVQSLPLSALVNRQADEKAARPSDDSDDNDGEAGGDSGKPEKTENEKADHPGKGKGKGK